MLVARISLTLSRHSSLSFIGIGRSSGQHPVSSHIIINLPLIFFNVSPVLIRLIPKKCGLSKDIKNLEI